MDERGFHVAAISQEPVSDRVVAQILSLVKAGNLKAGDRLPSERELAESFKVQSAYDPRST